MFNFYLLRVSTFLIIFSLFLFLFLFMIFNNFYNFNLFSFLFFENNLFYNLDLKKFFEFYNLNFLYFFILVFFYFFILGLYIHSYKGISHIFEEYLDLKVQKNIRNKVLLKDKKNKKILFKDFFCNFFIFFSILLLLF